LFRHGLRHYAARARQLRRDHATPPDFRPPILHSSPRQPAFFIDYSFISTPPFPLSPVSLLPLLILFRQLPPFAAMPPPLLILLMPLIDYFRHLHQRRLDADAAFAIADTLRHFRRHYFFVSQMLFVAALRFSPFSFIH
jgi:hypothetical protein